jgi:hypothetical protein
MRLNCYSKGSAYCALEYHPSPSGEPALAILVLEIVEPIYIINKADAHKIACPTAGKLITRRKHLDSAPQLFYPSSKAHLALDWLIPQNVREYSMK